jgi:hypothetical protein
LDKDPVFNPTHRHYFEQGVCDKYLFTLMEFFGCNVNLFNADSHTVSALNKGVPQNPREDPTKKGRGLETPLSEEEDVCGRALTYFTCAIYYNSIITIVLHCPVTDNKIEEIV